MLGTSPGIVKQVRVQAVNIEVMSLRQLDN